MLIHPVCSTALRSFSDPWASAQDVSYWDIGLAVLQAPRTDGLERFGAGLFQFLSRFTHPEDAGIDGEPSPKGGKYLLNLPQIPPDPVLQKGLDPVFLHFLWILSQELI